MEPIITYEVKRTNGAAGFLPTDDFYCGTCTLENPLKVDIRIWNNKNGVEAVDDLKDFVLNLYFTDLEDKSLLEYLFLEYNDVESVPLSIQGDMAVATFLNKVTLSGTPNDGGEDNMDNYINLRLTVNFPKDKKLKLHDLKALNLEIIQQ